MIHLLASINADPLSGSGPWYVAGLFVSSGFAYLASRSSKHSRKASEKVEHSVGPRNGQSLSEIAKSTNQIVTQLARSDEYQHTRNHDILNGISRIQLQLNNIEQQLEQVVGYEMGARPIRRRGSPRESRSTEDGQ